MGRGRKPKPPGRQFAEGDRSLIGAKKLAAKIEAEQASIARAARGLPDPPRHLGELARQQWLIWREDLEIMKQDYRADAVMLEGACVNYARAIENDEILKDGCQVEEPVLDKMTGEKVGVKIKNHPAAAISNACWRNVAMFCSDLGLSIVSRQRLSIDVGASGAKGQSLMDLLTGPRVQSLRSKCNENVRVPFSEFHADIACNFFEKILKHTQDEWAGEPFLLAPWEEEATREIFGRLDDDGNRLIRQVYLEVPKKSGKTEYCAGLILLVLLLDTNIGSQVYGAAAAQRQALNVFRAARTMVALSDQLKGEFRTLASTHRILKRSDPNSFYAAIAADGDLSDGVNPTAVIGDEVHRWRTRKQLENWDVLSLGGVTRRQALSVAITTAGVQSESPLAWRLHEKTLRIQEGIGHDPNFYGRIYSAQANDDWADEKTWIKAQPSLKQNGGFLDISKIRALYNSALTDPDLQRSFKRYFLNLWDQKEKRCIDLMKWDDCQRPWKAQGLLPKQEGERVRALPPELMAFFIDRRAYAGVDLSMTTDMTAVTFVFPAADGCFDLLPFFWMPEEGIKNRELRDGMPYRRWAEEGFLELCPGEVIDIREVRERLEWGDRMFDLDELCFDPSEARQLTVPMLEEGYSCIDIRQGYSMLSEPCKKILELVANRKLRHGAHPVLRWNAHCLSSKEHNDQLMWAKPERMKDSSRIDGISAATDAMARAMLPGNGPSIYESRGVLKI